MGISPVYGGERQFFTNASVDILRIYTDTLDGLGVEWTRTNARNISVARRKSVALMDSRIGPKY